MTYLVVIKLVSQPMIHKFTVVRVLRQSSYPLAVSVAALFVLVSRSRGRQVRSVRG